MPDTEMPLPVDINIAKSNPAWLRDVNVTKPNLAQGL